MSSFFFVFNCFLLNYVLLYCTKLYYFVLHCNILHCIEFYDILIHRSILDCFISHCIVLFYFHVAITYCYVLQCIVFYCIALSESCGAALYRTMLCGTILCGTILCGTILYATILCGTILCCTTSNKSAQLCIRFYIFVCVLHISNSILLEGITLYLVIEITKLSNL